MTPRRPFEKSQLDQELKVTGEYGLRNKQTRSVEGQIHISKNQKMSWRTFYTPREDSRRLFEGNTLLQRFVRIGVLDEGCMKLDYMLGLKDEDFLESRLQT